MRTIDLVDKAEATGKSLRQISIELGLKPNTLASARGLGKLSPAVALSLAEYVGEPPAKWAILAIKENERSAPMRARVDRLMRSLS